MPKIEVTYSKEEVLEIMETHLRGEGLKIKPGTLRYKGALEMKFECEGDETAPMPAVVVAARPSPPIQTVELAEAPVRRGASLEDEPIDIDALRRASRAVAPGEGPFAKVNNTASEPDKTRTLGPKESYDFPMDE